MKIILAIILMFLYFLVTKIMRDKNQYRFYVANTYCAEYVHTYKKAKHIKSMWLKYYPDFEVVIKKTKNPKWLVCENPYETLDCLAIDPDLEYTDVKRRYKNGREFIVEEKESELACMHVREYLFFSGNKANSLIKEI